MDGLRRSTSPVSVDYLDHLLLRERPSITTIAKFVKYPHSPKIPLFSVKIIYYLSLRLVILIASILTVPCSINLLVSSKKQVKNLKFCPGLSKDLKRRNCPKNKVNRIDWSELIFVEYSTDELVRARQLEIQNDKYVVYHLRTNSPAPSGWLS